MIRNRNFRNNLPALFCVALILLAVASGAWAQTGKRPALVLIHGLGSSAAVWDKMVPFMTNSYRIFTYEMPGHGTTPPIKHATIDNVVKHLEDFIAENDIDFPYVVGHAMGGVVAMKYTLAHPADVRRLVVMDAAPRQLATAEEKTAITEELIENYDLCIAQRFLAMSEIPSIRDRVVDQALRTDSATLITMLMDSFDMDIMDDLHKHTVPILVIGSNIFFPDPDLKREFLYHMGFYEAMTLHFKRLDECGHFAMLESPGRVAGAISTFAFDQ